MPNLQPHNLDYAFAGMAYPATHWQILAWADYNCATSNLRHALWQLPDKTYANQPAIVAALQHRLEPEPSPSSSTTSGHRSQARSPLTLDEPPPQLIPGLDLPDRDITSSPRDVITGLLGRPPPTSSELSSSSPSSWPGRP
jgi:hypothetical protein